MLTTSSIALVFEESSRNLRAAAADAYTATVERAVALLVQCFRAGNKLLVFGNGGSSADAQHVCGEFVGRFLRERRPLPAIALSANQAVLTAWANDYHFDTVFARQIEAHGKPGDVAWGISTSGNSPNVLRALEAARSLGLSTIGLAGNGGGRMSPLCDVLIATAVSSTPRIQEIHLVTYHAICAAVENALFAPCEDSIVDASAR